jgi:hypothetical protein
LYFLIAIPASLQSEFSLTPAGTKNPGQVTRSNEIGPNLVQKLFRMPRAALFAIQQDFAVRLLGGYTLMILAE